MLTSLFSLFYVTGEFHRFLHRGRAFNLLTMFSRNENNFSLPTFSVKEGFKSLIDNDTLILQLLNIRTTGC